MIVTIMQPAYLPWLGYFQRVARAEIFVVLDHVAIDRNSKTKFANRNKVRTKDGWVWLTVPLKNGSDRLDRIEIANDEPWARKHASTIRSSYGKAAYFADYGPRLLETYERHWDKLVDLTEASNAYFFEALGIQTKQVRSSELGVGGTKDALIVNICRELGATAYISGPFGRTYLDASAFETAGIELIFHDYAHPTYKQVMPGFEPYMSVVDLMMSCGPESFRILDTPSKEPT